jgi:hypothetical protein
LRHFVDFALLFSRTRAVSSYLIDCGLTPTFLFRHTFHPWSIEYTSLEPDISPEQVFSMAYYSQPKSGTSTFVEESTLQFSSEWSPGLDPDDLRELQAAQHDPTKIVSELPKEAVRLGYYSSICLIFNRMIGKLRLVLFHC